MGRGPDGKASVDTDFRDEVLAQIYDKGDPDPKRRLIFNIELSDQGQSKGRLITRVKIKNWKRIGHIVFDESVVSYHGDFVIHFAHPPRRNDRNNPHAVVRPNLRRSE